MKVLTGLFNFCRFFQPWFICSDGKSRVWVFYSLSLISGSVCGQCKVSLSSSQNQINLNKFNSGLKAISIRGQRKAFCGQRIPEFSSARKETVDIEILIKSRNGDKKIMQPIIRITTGTATRMRK